MLVVKVGCIQYLTFIKYEHVDLLGEGCIRLRLDSGD